MRTSQAFTPIRSIADLGCAIRRSDEGENLAICAVWRKAQPTTEVRALRADPHGDSISNLHPCREPFVTRLIATDQGGDSERAS